MVPPPDNSNEPSPHPPTPMSKTALFSDIHANLAALQAVISDAKNQGVSNFACLGDVVGYGPKPAECIALVQEVGCVCVKGNHDEDASNERSLDNLSDVAQESLYWTREKLSASQKEWLAALPYQRRLGRNLLVHASLENPSEWHYIRNKFDAEIALGNQKAPLCFFGHTHVPVVYHADGNKIRKMEGSEAILSKDSRYLINVGSVGQPRDGVPKACYAIYDSAKSLLTYRRLEYDISGVVQSIAEAGLSPDLGERLEVAA